MRFTHNGKTYRLREGIAIRLQGIALVLLGLVCHKVGADGIAIFLWFYGGLMLMPDFGKISRGVYWIAYGIIAHAEKKDTTMREHRVNK